ncbi:MAG: DUF2147 domain-containing protein [Cytophagaceae bacterium]
MITNFRIIAFVIAMLFISDRNIFAQIHADDVLGVWYVEGKEPAKVEIFKQAGKYSGKIIWLKNPVTPSGKPKNDKNNPDHKLRDRDVVGIQILTDLQFDGKSEWINGIIYDPESGNTYKCYMWLEGKDKLKVRGFLGLSVLGRTEEWKRISTIKN